MERILPQIEQQVKCANEWCSEDIYRDGLCFDHFIKVETQAWDDYADEIAQAHLVSAGRG